MSPTRRHGPTREWIRCATPPRRLAPRESAARASRSDSAPARSALVSRMPAIGLSGEDYGLLYRLAESKQGPKLRLDLDADLLGEQPAFNTVAVIKGTEKPDEYVQIGRA